LSLNFDSFSQALTQWSVEEVGQWIECICQLHNINNYKKNFVDNQVDGSALIRVTTKELEENLGIPSADAKTLETNIQQLSEFLGNIYILFIESFSRICAPIMWMSVFMFDIS
jgi:hypothetical protein